MASPPSLLKPLVPYLKHAQQLQVQDPLMSYYCKYYCVQEGIKLRSASPSDSDAKKFLLAMMDQLEEQKKTLGSLDELEGEVHVKDFALHVFDLADEEDRRGAANKNTALNFYAASQFFDVLKLFGELSADVLEKQKYAKWKAANINSCLKKGIQPKPGPPTQENEQTLIVHSSSEPSQPILLHPEVPVIPSTQQTFPNVPIIPNFDQQPKFSTNTSYQPTMTPTTSSTSIPSTTPAPTIVKPSQQSTPIPPPVHHSSSFTPAYQDIELATKHAKFAVSSLQFEDVPAAVKFLKLALKNLTNVEY